MSARSKNPTKRGNPQGPSTDEIPTKILGEAGKFGSETPTDIIEASKVPREPVTPIKAISMKTPSDAPTRQPDPPVLPHVQLRAMSEVARAQTPTNLGNLAPPYNAHEARKRTVQSYVMWGCLGVILASAIALVVWFVGRR